MRAFLPETRQSLTRQGWRLLSAPSGMTLVTLRDAGAPFKGDRFFRDQIARVHPAPSIEGEIAYRPGLMPESLNTSVADLDGLLTRLNGILPAGASAQVPPAATCIWLLAEHFARTGEWPLTGCFTWTADRYGDSGNQRLVAGVMSGTRPLMISPLPEGRGRGVGLLPIVVPVPPAAPILP